MFLMIFQMLKYEIKNNAITGYYGEQTITFYEPEVEVDWSSISIEKFENYDTKEISRKAPKELEAKIIEVAEAFFEEEIEYFGEH